MITLICRYIAGFKINLKFKKSEAKSLRNLKSFCSKTGPKPAQGRKKETRRQEDKF